MCVQYKSAAVEQCFNCLQYRYVCPGRVLGLFNAINIGVDETAFVPLW